MRWRPLVIILLLGPNGSCGDDARASAGSTGGDTSVSSSGSASAEATSETVGEGCLEGEVYVEPACDNGLEGTVPPPAGCHAPCELPGQPCSLDESCLLASVRLCECEGGGACCPECRGITPLCLDASLLACGRYSRAEDCASAPALEDVNESGHYWYCSWEQVVAVDDVASCELSGARGECVYNAAIGDGCDPIWSCAPDEPDRMTLYRGPPYELMRYDECIQTIPPGWTACGLGGAPAVCGCACSPDFPG